jgi:hypothetical protein
LNADEPILQILVDKRKIHTGSELEKANGFAWKICILKRFFPIEDMSAGEMLQEVEGVGWRTSISTIFSFCGIHL